jgi:ornithine cyclodeaminase
MAMIGNGAQSEFQIVAFNELLGISEFMLYDVDPNATDKLIDNLQSENNLVLKKFNSTSEAVRGCDIVTTCTADKKKATILTLDHIEAGMFLNAIGGDCPGKTELQKEILNNARVIVEYTPQTRIEGEIQQVGSDFKVTELHELIRGDALGRQNDQEITIFDSVGFSLEDFSVLKLMYQLALDNDLGDRIDITPNLKDVKDLYSLIS